MADPFRLQVQKALCADFEQITTTNGYTHDMIGKVFRGRAVFGTRDPIPMLSILESAEGQQIDFGPVDNASDTAPYNLIVQGFVDDDKANPTDPAHWLMAEVKHRLTLLRESARGPVGILGFGREAPMVDKLFWDGGVVRPPDGEISAKAYFWLNVTLHLCEDDTIQPS